MSPALTHGTLVSTKMDRNKYFEELAGIFHYHKQSFLHQSLLKSPWNVLILFQPFALTTPPSYVVIVWLVMQCLLPKHNNYSHWNHITAMFFGEEYCVMSQITAV